MLNKMQITGLIRCLSTYKRCKDPNFVFQYFKLPLTSKTLFGGCFKLVLAEKATEI